MQYMYSKNKILGLFLCFTLLFIFKDAISISRPGKTYYIFQFPREKIPSIDGSFDDWKIIPDSLAIGLSELKDTGSDSVNNPNSNDFDITVKVGWVNGLNRLYFYVEAYDDYWDITDPGLRQDIFELVVDADLSGGPFVSKENQNKNILPLNELYFKGHGAHAQNYHIFTPAQNKDWAMVWGNTPWIKEFPWANIVYDYDFKPGESGKLRMEFWITPFDYASIDGFEHSVESKLKENDIIGLSWCILDYDSDHRKPDAFINLAHDSRMVRNADYLNAFRLLPLSKEYVPILEANWSFIEISREQRIIQFMDKSVGIIKKWHWDFGDGNTSEEQNPKYQYNTPGEWTVVLRIEGDEGFSVRSKVWDVVTK